MVKRNRIATMSRIFAIVAIVVLLGAALGAGTALAAKGGVKGKPGGNGGGGNGGNGGSYATLTVSPNPAPAGGAVVDASGSGYNPSAGAYINIHTPNSLYVYTRGTDSEGNLSFFFNTAEPGTYTVKVYQYKGKKLVLKAQADLVVQ